MKRRTKYVLIILGVAVLYFIINFKINSFIETPEKYFSNHFKLGWTDWNVEGIVDDKYIDYKHHSYPTVVIKDSVDRKRTFFFQTHDLEFYEYVQIGDSIYSKSRSFKATIYRDTGSRTFRFLKSN